MSSEELLNEFYTREQLKISDLILERDIIPLMWNFRNDLFTRRGAVHE